MGEHLAFPAVQKKALGRAEARAAAGDRWCEARLADLRRAGAWNPFAFLGWCRVAGGHPWLAEVQAAEIDGLLGFILGMPGLGAGAGSQG